MITVTDQKDVSKDAIIEIFRRRIVTVQQMRDVAVGYAPIRFRLYDDYLYSWEDNNGVDLNINNDSLIGVGSSTYTVFVSDDNSCMDSHK